MTDHHLPPPGGRRNDHQPHIHAVGPTRVLFAGWALHLGCEPVALVADDQLARRIGVNSLRHHQPRRRPDDLAPRRHPAGHRADPAEGCAVEPCDRYQGEQIHTDAHSFRARNGENIYIPARDAWESCGRCGLDHDLHTNEGATDHG